MIDPQSLTKEQKKTLCRTMIAALQPKKLTEQREYELGVFGQEVYMGLEEFQTVNRFELAWILAGVIYEILYGQDEVVH